MESVERFKGCLLGGAVGDALGAPVEFSSINEIRSAQGPDGVTGYLPAYDRTGAITDDTQMSLFTAEGLLRAEQRYRDRGLVNVDAALRRAYQRWLSTQIDPSQVPWDPEFSEGSSSGWLIHQEFLHHRRAPGTTCLAALSRPSGGGSGPATNDSKGCGEVMRVAPVGLVARDPFDLGCRAAALTHGHPSGQVAAGALAVIVAALRRGWPLDDAVARGAAAAAGRLDGGEVAAALGAAVDLAGEPTTPTPETVESLGAGWVAEEALAIAVYCALVADDFVSGVLLAVNHSGDSDSTGSIAGNLLGASLGTDAIPGPWLQGLEGAEVIARVAEDLHAGFAAGGIIDHDRYPTW